MFTFIVNFPELCRQLLNEFSDVKKKANRKIQKHISFLYILLLFKIIFTDNKLSGLLLIFHRKYIKSHLIICTHFSSRVSQGRKTWDGGCWQSSPLIKYQKKSISYFKLEQDLNNRTMQGARIVVNLLILSWLSCVICIMFISSFLTNSFSDSMTCCEIILPEGNMISYIQSSDLNLT